MTSCPRFAGVTLGGSDSSMSSKGGVDGTISPTLSLVRSMMEPLGLMYRKMQIVNSIHLQRVELGFPKGTHFDHEG